MPAYRLLVAREGDDHFENVTAPPHGRGWGAVHEAERWRCILPGSGLVHWRRGEELLFVDPLTAFRLDPGDHYQLRHEGERRHLVYCSSARRTAPAASRAWLLRPRELFDIKRASRALRRGDAGVAQAAAAVSRSLARSQPLDVNGGLTVLDRARQCLAGDAGASLPIEALGEEVRCSPFHLTRLFGRELGTTPHQYRLHLRLALAMERLEAGDADLAGLAHDLGFCSQSHFGEVVRRALGCTPREARQALAAGI